MIWPLSVDFILKRQLRRSKSFSKVFEALKTSQNDTAVFFLLLVLFLQSVLFILFYFIFKLTFNVSFLYFPLLSCFFSMLLYKILQSFSSCFFD